MGKIFANLLWARGRGSVCERRPLGDEAGTRVKLLKTRRDDGGPGGAQFRKRFSPEIRLIIAFSLGGLGGGEAPQKAACRRRVRPDRAG